MSCAPTHQPRRLATGIRRRAPSLSRESARCGGEGTRPGEGVIHEPVRIERIAPSEPMRACKGFVADWRVTACNVSVRPSAVSSQQNQALEPLFVLARRLLRTRRIRTRRRPRWPRLRRPQSSTVSWCIFENSGLPRIDSSIPTVRWPPGTHAPRREPRWRRS